MINLMEISNLNATVEQTEILKGIDLIIPSGQVHVLMGANGAGKSSLASALMGHPDFKVSGSIKLDGREISDLPVFERALAGLFLAFQHPIDLPGVTVMAFLRTVDAVRAKAKGEKPMSPADLTKQARELIALFGLDKAFLRRNVNEGFSGGEKKRLEMIQMCFLAPTFAILDEPDSGLDIDALEMVVKAIDIHRSQTRSALVISHNPTLVRRLAPDAVHIIKNGVIAVSGGMELVDKLEIGGYDNAI